MELAIQLVSGEKIINRETIQIMKDKSPIDNTTS